MDALYFELLLMHSTMFLKRAGFWSAMASNLTNQSRNVLSKKVMVKNEVILPSQIHNFIMALVHDGLNILVLLPN